MISKTDTRTYKAELLTELARLADLIGVPEERSRDLFREAWGRAPYRGEGRFICHHIRRGVSGKEAANGIHDRACRLSAITRGLIHPSDETSNASDLFANIHAERSL
jgi:hypothetical protein